MTFEISSRFHSAPSRRFRAWAVLLGLAALLLVSAAAAKTHTVYEGQRLGSIAKRYNISVDELCAANGITSRDPIHPGQKLVIPDKSGKTSSKATKSSSKSKTTSKASKSKPGDPRWHTVAKGHTLSAISGRYAVTISAICNANGIDRSAGLTVGERLIIPAKSDKDGSYARSLRVSGKLKSESKASSKKDADSAKKSSKSWKKYVKPAWRRGYITIRRYGRSWKGYVIGPKGEVLGQASNKINYVMGAKSDGPRIDPRLIRLIAKVSDTFGGREMRIVSGIREKSFVADSKHKTGRAIDFSIPGVPNEALRDYLRTLPNVGVGYYPNSSFVHFDVRSYNAYWVDYAGPGQAPRKSPSSTAKKAPATKAAPTKSDDAK